MIEKYKSVILNSKIILSQLKAPKEVCKELILTPCRPEKLDISIEENKKLIEKISIITANKKECEKIFKTSDIEKCVEMYPNKLIVTLGKDGVMYHNGIKVVKMPALEIEEVKDTTGAGDTLNGNLAASIINKYTLKTLLLEGNMQQQ